MKLVIEIDEEDYERCKKKYQRRIDIMGDAIANGTPLPKECGRLIDADKFLKDNKNYTGFILNSRFFGGKNAYKDTLEDLINEADTIIEAYKEM